jgi:L-fucose mutarotase
MLKNIPTLLGPELVKILMEMGHGDEIVIGDGNFPAASIASETLDENLIRMDGHSVPEVLEAILELFPLDEYSDEPVALMEVVEGDTVKTPIWDKYREIIEANDEAEKFDDFEYVERFDFYDRAKEAFAVIATSEAAQYANVILKKGCIVAQ